MKSEVLLYLAEQGLGTSRQTFLHKPSEKQQEPANKKFKNETNARKAYTMSGIIKLTVWNWTRPYSIVTSLMGLPVRIQSGCRQEVCLHSCDCRFRSKSFPSQWTFHWKARLQQNTTEINFCVYVYCALLLHMLLTDCAAINVLWKQL